MFLKNIVLLFLQSLISLEAIKPNYYWRDFDSGYIPSDAFEASVDGNYIGQIFLDGFLPATLYPAVDLAVVERRGTKASIKDNIKIFCTPEPKRFYWELINFGTPPGKQMNDAVKGGFEKYYNLFIGKVYDDLEWKVGRVVPYIETNSGLHLWNRLGRFWNATEFYILKYNSTTSGCN